MSVGLLSVGAFVHALYYLADAFSIIPNNYIYIFTYIHIYKYIYIYVYVYAYAYTYTYIHVGRYVCVRAAFIR